MEGSLPTWHQWSYREKQVFPNTDQTTQPPWPPEMPTKLSIRSRHGRDDKRDDFTRSRDAEYYPLSRAHLPPTGTLFYVR